MRWQPEITVDTRVELSWLELQYIKERCESHYDGVVQAAAIPGRRAFVNGMIQRALMEAASQNVVEWGATELPDDFRCWLPLCHDQIGTILKALETEMSFPLPDDRFNKMGMFFIFKRLLFDLEEEWKSLNEQIKDKILTV